jgi:hypothetical protein
MSALFLRIVLEWGRMCRRNAKNERSFFYEETWAR